MKEILKDIGFILLLGLVAAVIYAVTLMTVAVVLGL